MRPKSNDEEGFLCAKSDSGRPADKRAYFVRQVVLKCGVGCQDSSGGNEAEKGPYSV